MNTTPEHLHAALNHIPLFAAGFAILPFIHALTKRSPSSLRLGLVFLLHEEFFRQFAHGGDVKFDGTTRVRRDVPVFITFFITGPGLDSSGAADVSADITVRKPDGSVYFEGKGAPCWSGKYPYTPESTQVADAKVQLRIETADPAGEYSVQAIVHDKIKKVDLSLKKTFNVAQ